MVFSEKKIDTQQYDKYYAFVKYINAGTKLVRNYQSQEAVLSCSIFSHFASPQCEKLFLSLMQCKFLETNHPT